MRARKSAARVEIGPLGHAVADQVGHQERGHQLVRLVRLDREPGQQDLGLGLRGCAGAPRARGWRCGRRPGPAPSPLRACRPRAPPRRGAGRSGRTPTPPRRLSARRGRRGSSGRPWPATRPPPGPRPPPSSWPDPSGPRSRRWPAAGAPDVAHVGGAHRPRSASSPRVRPGPIGHGPHGQEDAGHEGTPVVGVVADRQALPHGAEDHLLVGDQPGQAHRVDAYAAGTLAPLAPASTCSVVGSARQRTRCRRAAGRRRSLAAVCKAVPDGASRLAS